VAPEAQEFFASFFQKRSSSFLERDRMRLPQYLMCPFEPAARRKEQKFFVSFFQKRNTSFFVGVSVFMRYYEAPRKSRLPMLTPLCRKMA
jgi:hypothetical protein